MTAQSPITEKNPWKDTG